MGDNLRKEQVNVRQHRGSHFSYRWFLISIALLATSAAIQILLMASLKGFLGDQQIFIYWMKVLHEVGLQGAYNPRYGVNYPPISIYMFDLFERILLGFHIRIHPGGVGFRIPILLCTLFFMALCLYVARRFKPASRMVFSTFMLFNPALIFVGPVWGQIDIIYMGFLAFSVFWLEDRPIASGICAALSFSTKMQAIILIPIFGAWLIVKVLRGKHAVRSMAGFVGGFALTLVVVWLPVILKGSLIAMIKMSYFTEVGMFPLVTVKAMNVWYYVLGVAPHTNDANHILNQLTLKDVGLLMLAVVCVYVVGTILVRRVPWTKELAFEAASVVAFAFFMLSTEIHERYIIPAVILFVFSALYNRKWRGPALAVTVTAFFNMLAVCYTGVNPESDLWMVYVNVATLVYVLFLFYQKTWRPEIS